MRKRIRTLGLVTLLGTTTMASLSRAERVDDKLFVELGLGGGLTIGRHAWSDNGYPEQTLNESEMIAAPTLNLTFTPAFALSRFAFGIMLDGLLTIPDGGYDDDCAAIGSASAIAMTRAKSGLGAAIAFGYASAGKTCSKSFNIATNYPNGFVPTDHSNESMAGPKASALFGFTTLSGIGFATTASYAYLWGDDSTYAPLSLVMQVTVSGW